jgi:hypothetical protein
MGIRTPTAYNGPMDKNDGFPYSTLFMLMSLDGKISTGSVDERDFDKDLPNVKGVTDGLHQYYVIQTRQVYQKMS